MFDFLKKKISGFVDKLVKREEEKKPEPIAKPPEKKEMPETPPKKQPGVVPKKEPPKPAERKTLPIEPKPPIEPKKVSPAPEPIRPKEPPPKATPPLPEKKPAIPKEEVAEKPREVKVGIFSAIKGLVTGEVEIAENEVAPLLEELELELLEGDVALEVAETITQQLGGQLVGAKIKRGELNGFVKARMVQVLKSTLENEKQFDLVAAVAGKEKPVTIMFLGPNGAGKTTSMAKVTKLLMNNGKKVVLAAGDTFRAAAIEQLSIHAERLKVPIIKRPYGSDATAVAYDAVNYAKAHGIDVVLIDTAGRQDTNVNLLNELRKMQRVIQPTFKIYIGESIAGNAVIEQVRAFHDALGVDGVILTKLDCDPKGGTTLSISKMTGRPILYVGTGQGYGDLEVFDADAMVRRMLG